MPGAHSSRRTVRFKPKKPDPKFPLYAHSSGYWAKKINGRVYYFGQRWWGDPYGALREYNERADALEAGRPYDAKRSVLTVRDAVNRFLTARQHKRDSGEITPRTFKEYKITCGRIVAQFGKGADVEALAPQDFTAFRAVLAKGRGLVALGNEIQRVRCVFRWCYEEQLIEQALRFGAEFKRPTKAARRRHKATQPEKMFAADEILAMIDEAGVHLAAMIWLGINCGFGNHDCGKLPLSAVDLKEGWITFPRPKTGVARRCPLWPETIEALKKSRRRRPQPTVDVAGGLFFVTRDGLSWFKETTNNPISNRTASVLKRLGIYQEGVGFYSLRHTFVTIGDDTGDTVAVQRITGQVDPSVTAEYRERISDARITRVTDHVREWLFKTKEEISDEAT